MSDSQKLDQTFVQQIPPGDEQTRSVCGHCGFVDYKNPKIVVGSVAVWNDTILLCRRAIEPRRGFWTIPAGYMELNETPEAGAAREAQEEACADIVIDRLLAIYSVPRISQVQLMFRARLASPDVAIGPESLEVQLCKWGDIPWPEMAFPTAVWALKDYWRSRQKTQFPPFTNPAP
ncbi:MAG: NUDIX hydrolase [Pseudomonadota bacterium]